MAPTAAITSDFVIYNRRLTVVFQPLLTDSNVSSHWGREGLVGFQPDIGGEGVRKWKDFLQPGRKTVEGAIGSQGSHQITIQV